MNIYYITCKDIIPNNTHFNHSHVNKLRKFIYKSIKDGSITTSFLKLVNIPYGAKDTYSKPYGYQWGSYSCAYNSKLAVISNLFFILDNEEERETYISTFPYTYSLFFRLDVLCEIKPNQMKVY